MQIDFIHENGFRRILLKEIMLACHLEVCGNFPNVRNAFHGIPCHREEEDSLEQHSTGQRSGPMKHFKPTLPLPAADSWASYLAVLCFSLLTCKVGTVVFNVIEIMHIKS